MRSSFGQLESASHVCPVPSISDDAYRLLQHSTMGWTLYFGTRKNVFRDHSNSFGGDPQIIISPGIPCCFIIVLLTLEGSLWLVWRRHRAGAFSGQADFSWGRKNSGSHPQHLRRPAIPKKLWEWRLLRHEGFSREPVQPKIQTEDLWG